MSRQDILQILLKRAKRAMFSTDGQKLFFFFFFKPLLSLALYHASIFSFLPMFNQTSSELTKPCLGVFAMKIRLKATLVKDSGELQLLDVS